MNTLKIRLKDNTVLDQMDDPYTVFSIQFVLYKYFNIVYSYDRGRFGCSIVNGDVGIGLDNSQKWYDSADLNVFLKELGHQIELRIPDKFLEHYRWK